MFVRRVGFMGLLVGAGCGPAAPTGADESSGSTTEVVDTSSTGTTTSGPDFGSSDTSTSDSEDSSSTGALEDFPPRDRHVRLLMTSGEEDPLLYRISIVEYDGGDLLPEILLDENVRGPSERFVTEETFGYCDEGDLLPTPCFAVDLTQQPPVVSPALPPPPFDGAAAGEPIPSRVAGAPLLAIDYGNSDGDVLAVFPYEDGVVGERQILADNLDGFGHSRRVLFGQTRLAYTLSANEGHPIFAGSVGESGVVEELGFTDARGEDFRFVPGTDVIAVNSNFGVDFVDLSGSAPGPVVTSEVLSASRLASIAPDGHAAALLSPAPNGPGVAWVALDEGLPATEALIDDVDIFESRDVAWSASGRWMTYARATEVKWSSIADHYLVPTAGAMPGEPIDLGEYIEPGAQVLRVAFDSTDTWAYLMVRTEVEEFADALYRVELGDGTLGEVQLVADAWLRGGIDAMTLSADDSAIVYMTGAPELYWVDLRGASPGTPIALTATAANGFRWSIVGLSGDGSVLLYTRRISLGVADLEPLWLVDATTGDTQVLTERLGWAKLLPRIR